MAAKSRFKTKPEQYYQVSKAQRYAALHTKDGADGDITVDGVVKTPHGICTAESNRHRYGKKGEYNYRSYSSLQFIYDGRSHYLYDEQFRTERSLALLAYAFVKAIVNGERL